MPSFDVSSEVHWQELDNAIHQTIKELTQRFDFKGVRSEIKLELKEKKVILWCSEEGKLDALNDLFQGKLVKRGISLLVLDYQKIESAFGGSVRQEILVQAGIAQEKAKKLTGLLKQSKLKVQGQIQGEQLRVTGKNRDDLQAAIEFLKKHQVEVGLPLQFGNFRD
jgi:hypothetical protein